MHQVDVPENFRGDTALIAASEVKRTHYFPTKYISQAGKIDVVKSLLRAGAEVDARDTYGLTALHKVGGILVWCKIRQIKHLDQPPPSLWENYHLFCILPFSRFAFNKRRNLYDVVTAFLKAARKNKIEVVKALLEAGANPNLQGLSQKWKVWQVCIRFPLIDFLQLGIRPVGQHSSEQPQSKSSRCCHSSCCRWSNVWSIYFPINGPIYHPYMVQCMIHIFSNKWSKEWYIYSPRYYIGDPNIEDPNINVQRGDPNIGDLNIGLF